MVNQTAVNRPPITRLPALMTLVDDQEILDNIDGRMHGPMSGFIEKYFGGYQYIYRDSLLEIYLTGKLICRCAVPSAAPSPDDFLEWFFNFISPELDGARGSWHASSGNEEAEHEIADGGASLLLTIPASPAANTKTKWDCVQVIGQVFGHSRVCYQDGLLRLCRSAFEVFASQPTRLFLHGFYVRGSLIELWVFDRSGLYSSDVLDVRKDFNQFISLILSYQRMTDHDLGNPNIIGTDKDGSYLLLDDVVASSLGKLYLESQPIASRYGIVGTGTVCYRARRPDANQWNYVLKLKWRWARDRPEDELLNLAKRKCVWGAVSLDYYKEVESTANLRRGLRWGPHRRFSRAHFDTAHRKDKRQEGFHDADGLFEYTELTDNLFQNRILTCTLTSPVGRPLHTFHSLLELLQVFHDAIKCHRSLYSDAKILHQDISPGNIIILDSLREEDPKGILIDLDSARELTEGLEAEGITGTRPFMAIGVLKNECHTYRHDLESFLYVFLWTIITNHMENLLEASKLRHWSNGEWNELALLKIHHMDQDFQTILQEFPPEFCSLKPLAENLRQILFPPRAGVIWTGTDSSQKAIDLLYDGMISTFKNAIAFESGSQI